MNLTKLERHYEVNILADDLYSEQDWKELNDNNVNDLPNRVKIAEAILSGKVPIKILEFDDTLDVWGY